MSFCGQDQLALVAKESGSQKREDRCLRPEYVARLIGRSATYSYESVRLPAGFTPGSGQEARFVALVYEHMARDDNFRKGYYVNVHSKVVESQVGRGYRDVVRGLAERGVVEVNDRYSVGRFPKSFRLARSLRTSRSWLLSVGRRDPLSLKIQLRESDWVGQEILRCMSLVRLDSEYQATGWAAPSVDRFRAGHFYANRCRYGRLHYNITSLPRDARSHLVTPAGERLCESVSAVASLSYWPRWSRSRVRRMFVISGNSAQAGCSITILPR